MKESVINLTTIFGIGLSTSDVKKKQDNIDYKWPRKVSREQN